MADASFADQNETYSPRMAADSFTLGSFVDEVECRVEKLRRDAQSLMGERASLLMIMDHLKNDCLHVGISSEDSLELMTNMDRLKARCEAVEIAVHTVRDEGQKHSLHTVNTVLDELQSKLVGTHTTGPNPAMQQAKSYLNACLTEALGPIDSRFQSMVLGCTVDDQKDVRRRLENLIKQSKSGLSRSGHPRTNTDFVASNRSSSSTVEENAEDQHSEDLPGGKPLPSDVVVDRKPGTVQAGNHKTAEWFSSSRDSAAGGARPCSGTDARDKEHESRVSHSGS